MDSVKVEVGKVEDFLVKNKDKIIENVVMSAMPLLMLIFARRGYKLLIKFEIFAFTAHALVLLFCPNTIFKHLLNSKLDLYHYNLCTLLAAASVGHMLYPLFLMDSKDDSVLTGYSWSRTITHAMGIMVVVNTYKFESEWSYRLLCTYGASHIAGFLCHGYYYVKNSKPRSHSTFNDTINYFSKLESFKGLIYGLMFFAFPNLVLSHGTNSHKLLARVIGSILFSMGLQAHGVADFMYLADKKSFILSRLISGFLMLQALLVGFYFYQTASVVRMTMVVGGFLTYSAILAIGYCSAKVKND